MVHLQFQCKPCCFAQISADCLLTVSLEIPLSQQRYSCPQGQMPHTLDPSAISGFLERCGSDKAIPSHTSREDLVSATARWTRMATFGHKGRLPCVPVLENVGSADRLSARACLCCLPCRRCTPCSALVLAPLGVQSPSLMLRGLSNGCLVVENRDPVCVVPSADASASHLVLLKVKLPLLLWFQCGSVQCVAKNAGHASLEDIRFFSF